MVDQNTGAAPDPHPTRSVQIVSAVRPDDDGMAIPILALPHAADDVKVLAPLPRPPLKRRRRTTVETVESVGAVGRSKAMPCGSVASAIATAKASEGVPAFRRLQRSSVTVGKLVEKGAPAPAASRTKEVKEEVGDEPDSPDMPPGEFLLLVPPGEWPTEAPTEPPCWSLRCCC